MTTSATIQDRGPNFRGERGDLFLIRCYACNPERGTENYGLAVIDGICAWCGWRETKEENQHESP